MTDDLIEIAATTTAAETLGELVELAPLEVQHRLRNRLRLAAEGYSTATGRALVAAWRVWWAYVQRGAIDLFPTDLAPLETFLKQTLASGRGRSTLDLYVYALNRLYRWAEVPSPLKTEEGRLVLKALRKNAGAEHGKKKAIGDVEIRMILALLTDDPVDVRDRALLMVAYETLMRRSELAAMQVDWIDFKSDGTGAVLLKKSKIDQEGKGKRLPISAETVEFLRAWMQTASIESGSVWRTIPLPRFGNAYKAPLSGAAIAQIFKKRAKQVDLDPALIGAHSTRIGAAEDLVAGGATDIQAMHAGRWKSTAMVIRYTEHLRDNENAMMVLRKKKGRMKNG